MNSKLWSLDGRQFASVAEQNAAGQNTYSANLRNRISLTEDFKNVKPARGLSGPGTLLFGPKAKHLETIDCYTFLVALRV